MMKKMLMIMILTVSVNPVSAATEILPVASLNASYADGRVSYSGIVTSAVKAAAVLLFDFDGNLIMMDTCGVTGDGAFSGTMEIMLTRSGTYTVKASDYEGGAFTESTFIMNASSSSDNPNDTPEEKTDNTSEDKTDNTLEGKRIILQRAKQIIFQRIKQIIHQKRKQMIFQRRKKMIYLRPVITVTLYLRLY
jgi:hypothetical protein